MASDTLGRGTVAAPVDEVGPGDGGPGTATRWATALGVGLLVVAVATSSWNVVSVGPFKLTHAALVLAAVVLGVVAARRRLVVWAPAWVWLLAAAIVVVAVAPVLLPPDAPFFLARYVDGLPNAVVDFHVLGPASVASGLRWLVAALLLPLAVCVVAPGRPRLIVLMADAWAAGIAVSATIASTDLFGLTRVNFWLWGLESWNGRMSGLAVHPNHLSVGIVMALPVVVWRLARARRPAVALWPVVLGVPMLTGLWAGGSRSALAAAVVVVLVALLVEPRTRRLVPALAAAGVVVGAVALVVTPGAVELLTRWFRLDGGGGSSTSDRIRLGLADQAWADFLHAPVQGIGLEVLNQGHSLFLQVLASGGVILLVGYLLAQLGLVLDAWSVDDGGTGLARALVVCQAALLIDGVVSNQIADLYVFVPFALAAGLCAAAALRGPAATTVATPAAVEEGSTA